MTKSSSSASSDTPISSRKEDKFGRANFAENMAKSIAGVPAEDGFVFALNAPWGSGKTSTLNMVQEALQKDAKVRNGKQFIIVNFNPWWFSGGDSLAHNFFSQFSNAMKQEGIKNPNRSEQMNRLADGLDAFGGLFSPAVSMVAEPHVATAAVTGSMLVKYLARVVKWMSPDSVKGIDGIRENIRNLLGRMSNLRVLVVMDDLDRIQPNEMREMFRLVRGAADFPNTIYLLSFDRDAVVDAIAEQSGQSGKGEENIWKKLFKCPWTCLP